MKLRNLATLPVPVILFFLVSCAARDTSSLPASESESTKPVTGAVSIDAVQLEWEKTIIEAKKEGRIVVYGTYGLALARDPLIRAFSEKFGMALEMTIAQPPELITKLLSERKTGLYIADVFMGGAPSILNDLIPRNILEPIEPYLILPEVKDPSVWLGGHLPFWEKQKVSLATVAIIPTGETGYNTSLLKPEELTSYNDLLKPKLKGLMVMSDPTRPGGGNSWYHLAMKLMGEDYIKELVKQDLVITRDFRLMTEWIARGKYPLGLGAQSGGIRDMMKDGAPVAILAPFKEGVSLGPAGGIVAAINKNPHPNATRLFINWLLSKEGQTKFSKIYGLASRRLDVPTDHLASPWMVPDPKTKYIIQDEDYTRSEIESHELAKKIFAPVLK